MNLEPELTTDERLFALASTMMRHQDWCALCDGRGFGISPFAWCPRIREPGHGRYIPRGSWTVWRVEDF